jgi:hypothetical protein
MQYAMYIMEFLWEGLIILATPPLIAPMPLYLLYQWLKHFCINKRDCKTNKLFYLKFNLYNSK